MTLVLIVAVLAWVASTVFIFWLNNNHWVRIYALLDRYDSERQVLLDRIMSRDFAQYKQAEVYQSMVEKAQQQAGQGEPPDWEVGE